MRHFFQVDADGNLIGTVAQKGGFTDEHDLTDLGCMHPLVIDLRKASGKVEGFDRHVEFNCPCPVDAAVYCQCPHTELVNYYADGSSLVAKPALTVLVDGVPLGDLLNSDPVVRNPGTTVSLKLQASAPDGHTVDVISPGLITILPAPETLVFTGGETQEIQLMAPTHAAIGRVLARSKYVRQFRVQLKGWAS